MNNFVINNILLYDWIAFIKITTVHKKIVCDFVDTLHNIITHLRILRCSNNANISWIF